MSNGVYASCYWNKQNEKKDTEFYSMSNGVQRHAAGADGRTRTGTVIHRLILSQVRMPISPHRLLLKLTFKSIHYLLRKNKGFSNKI